MQLLLDSGADVSAGVRFNTCWRASCLSKRCMLSMHVQPCLFTLLQDKDGYTPLHIAAGYLNRGVVRLLLAAGADPELSDKQGRSALDLIVALKQNTPTTPDFFARRGALDDVAKARAAQLRLSSMAGACVSLRHELLSDGACCARAGAGDAPV